MSRYYKLQDDPEMTFQSENESHYALDEGLFYFYLKTYKVKILKEFCLFLPEEICRMRAIFRVLSPGSPYLSINYGTIVHCIPLSCHSSSQHKSKGN